MPRSSRALGGVPVVLLPLVVVALGLRSGASAEEWHREPLVGEAFSVAIPDGSRTSTASGCLQFLTRDGLEGYGYVQPSRAVIEQLRRWAKDRYADLRTADLLADGVGRLFLKQYADAGLAIAFDSIRYFGCGGVDVPLGILSVRAKAKDGTPMRLDVAANVVGEHLVALTLARVRPTGDWADDATASRVLRSVARGPRGPLPPTTFDAARAIVAVRKSGRPADPRASLEPSQIVLIDPTSGTERPTKAVRGAVHGARHPSWSRDRARIVFSSDGDAATALYRENLYVHDLASGSTRRLTDWTGGGEGRGTIRGRVEVVETGSKRRRPAGRGFLVAVAGLPDPVALDAEGRFEAIDVPAGRRWVRVHGKIDATEHAAVAWVDVPAGGAATTSIELRWCKLRAGEGGRLVGVVGLDNFAGVALTEPVFAPDGSVLFVEKHHVVSNGASMKLVTRTRSWDASPDASGRAWQPDETSSASFEARSDTLGWSFVRLGRVGADGGGFTFLAGRLAPVASVRVSPRGDAVAYELDGGELGWDGSVAVHGPSRLVVAKPDGSGARVLDVPLDPVGGFGFGPDGTWVVAVTQVKGEWGPERWVERIVLATGERRRLAHVPDTIVAGGVDVSPDGGWAVVEYGRYPTSFEGWAQGFEAPDGDLWLIRLGLEGGLPVPLTTGGTTLQPSWK